MVENDKHQDLRIKKTRRALLEALSKLMAQKNFKRITVNDICDESQMSRTAFYSHFDDKYDLLKYWLSSRRPEISSIRNDYKEIYKAVNGIIDNNKDVLINLLEGANSETTQLVNEFITSFLVDFTGKSDLTDLTPFDIIFHNFCVGGITNLVLWQIKNKFPIDFKLVNTYSYEILDTLRQLGIDNYDNSEKSQKSEL